MTVQDLLIKCNEKKTSMKSCEGISQGGDKAYIVSERKDLEAKDTAILGIFPSIDIAKDFVKEKCPEYSQDYRTDDIIYYDLNEYLTNYENSDWKLCITCVSVISLFKLINEELCK